jgi:hypothetical protein
VAQLVEQFGPAQRPIHNSYSVSDGRIEYERLQPMQLFITSIGLILSIRRVQIVANKP